VFVRAVAYWVNVSQGYQKKPSIISRQRGFVFSFWVGRHHDPKTKTNFISLQKKHVFLYSNTTKHEPKPQVEKEIDKPI